jgi:hypothetical protein
MRISLPESEPHSLMAFRLDDPRCVFRPVPVRERPRATEIPETFLPGKEPAIAEGALEARQHS